MIALLLDDHPLCQEALADILRKRLGQIETACATTVDEALQAISETPPDLVIADLSTENVGGRLETVIAAAGEARVVALDVRHTPSNARRALAAGAKAYIPKTSTRELIDAALGVVLAGGSYFPDTSATRAAQPPGPDRLSPRQLEVLDLVHQGFSNNEIARALGISVATVKLHVHAILKATGARNRTDLVVRNVQRRATSAS